MTLADAFELLRDIPDDFTLDDLSSLANSFSVNDIVAVDGAPTHLYTKFDLREFINSSGDGIRVIDHTEVAELLVKDGLFKDAVDSIISRENPLMSEREIQTKVANYLYGTDTNGTTGPWADASARFAAETSGEVIVHIGDVEAATTRTWWNTEMSKILDNTKITSINGVPHDEIRQIYQTLSDLNSRDIVARDNVCRLISTIASDNVDSSLLDTARVYLGNGDTEFKIGLATTINDNVDNLAFTASISEVNANSFSFDADVRTQFGNDYDNFTAVEKMQAKQIDYYVRQITNLDGAPITDDVLARYLTASGKTVDTLNDADRAALAVAKKIGDKSGDIANLLSKASNYDNVLKAASKVGGIVDVVATTAIIGMSINDAVEAYNCGDTSKAIKMSTVIVMGYSASACISTLSKAA